MTPKLLVAAFLLNVGSLSAVELRGVVVESTEGIFLINNLKVDGSGTDQSFRVKWNGSITNNTGKEWHKVTFCGKGFGDTAGDMTASDLAARSITASPSQSTEPAQADPA